jgi:hemerythrin-like domain-containing protein
MARTTTARKKSTKSKSSSSSRSKSASARGAKDAIAFLKEEHQNVKKLLAELEEATGRSAKRRTDLLERIAMEVESHAQIEEEIFYPAFRERGDAKEDEKLFFEAAEEHRLVKDNMPELQATDPTTELFSARAKVMKDLIEHHAEEEESELFPRARELMSSDELKDLGRRLEQRKLELTGRRNGR